MSKKIILSGLAIAIALGMTMALLLHFFGPSQRIDRSSASHLLALVGSAVVGFVFGLFSGRLIRTGSPSVVDIVRQIVRHA